MRSSSFSSTFLFLFLRLTSTSAALTVVSDDDDSQAFISSSSLSMKVSSCFYLIFFFLSKRLCAFLTLMSPMSACLTIFDFDYAYFCCYLISFQTSFGFMPKIWIACSLVTNFPLILNFLFATLVFFINYGTFSLSFFILFLANHPVTLANLC